MSDIMSSISSSAPSAAPPPPPLTAREVLEQASALIKEGRFQQAIREATKHNRQLRDPELEHRLVIWRHRAYSAISPMPRPDWPPPVPDLFPASKGVPPEIPALGLSPDTLAAGILHHGCLIVRGLLSRPEATDLANGITHVFENMRAARAGTSLEQTLPWFAPFPSRGDGFAKQRAAAQRAGAAVWTADSPRMLFDLVEVFERHHVIDTIEQYLGERPVLSVEKATLRLVPFTTGTDWHQDGAFLGEDIRAVNVWLALSPCGVDSPGLDLMPRRIPYVVQSGTHGAKFSWSVGQEQVAIEADGTPIASPIFEPGDAVLFDQLCLHRTGVRPGMTKDRWAIESWFFAPSTKPAAHHAIVV
jgi:hypothetical protein